ncbi:MAG TPA: filamentous hemagglutinin N-terminal domain-containing protein, partial [Acetobacteraceae bacterium]|nr:filamentous hemagglutinin N-terminal domain-containing protein [Acetobacteraceae bacterium]
MKLLGVVRRRRPALLVSTALCATVCVVVSLPAAAQPAPNALPTGGAVFGGSASISQSGNQTTINQATQRAAINWQSFNVGSQAQVQFNQPNAAAVALNRVTGPNPSQIAGRLDANGQVIIENQSGVMFYKGSQVNTAGLMVSAASSSDAATRTFLNGGKLVTDLPANPNAAVVNQGQITVKQAGLAALVAPQVRNDGVIIARLGHVVLASGTETTLDLYGDGLMSIDVTGLVKTLPNGATALVTNSGIIVADGGTVQLTARAADGIVQTLVDAGGKIRANTIGSHVGTIRLAGVGGNITIEGQLEARGNTPGTTGGNIVVNPSGVVNVAATARIDASGQAGGGVVALGTTLKRAKGGPGVTATHTSSGVYIAPGARIAADATMLGDGGRVTVLSSLADGTTVMDGTISATGGPLGGNGGFIETSGHLLGMASTASVTAGALAPGWAAGTWLLDPVDVTISTSPTDGSVATAGGIFQASSVSTANIFNGDIESALNTPTNVTITTACGGGTCNGPELGSITDSAPITWTTAASLTFHADNNIVISPSSAITGTSGALTLSAGNTTSSGSITIGSPITVANFTASSGTAGSIAVNASVVATGSLSMTAGTGGIGLAANLGTTSTQLTNLVSGGTIGQTGGSITSQTLAISAVGPVSLPGANAAGTLAAQLTGSGNGFAFNNTGAGLTIGTVGTIAGIATNGGSISLSTTTSGDLTLAGNLTASGQTVSLISAGTIGQTGGSIVAATLTGSSAGTSQLTATNAVVSLGSFAASGGDFDFTNVGSIGVAGSVSASNATITAGTIGVSGSIVAAAGLVKLVGTSATGGIAISGTALLNGGTVDLSTGAGITEATTATLVAGTLQSTGGAGATVSLPGSGNAVSNLGSFTVTGGDFDLANARSISVVGSVSANDATITAGTIGVSGSIIASAGSLDLISTGGSIGLAGNALLNGGTVALASATSIAEATSSTIIATSFAASASAGAIGLLGTANTLATVTGLSATGGGATLYVGSTTTLTGSFSGTSLLFDVAHTGGTLQFGSSGTGAAGATLTATAASNPTISLIADNISEGSGTSAISAGASGTLAIAPFTSATPVVLGGTSGGGTLGIGTTLLGDVASTGLLRVGAAAGSLTAGGIALAGSLNLGTVATALELDTSGAVTQPGTAALAVGTLAGSMANGATLLGTGNAVGALGAITIASGNFTLVDTGSLSVPGSLSAANVALTAGSIGVSGSIVAASGLVLLDGTTGIAMTGTALVNGGTVDLSSGGGITEATTSTLIAGTLQSSGSAGATVSLLGSSNAIGDLGNFTVAGGDFDLANAGSISVVGSVGATNATITADAIVVSGSVFAVDLLDLISTGGSIGLSGNALLNGGTVALASAKSIAEATTATIIATSFGASASAGAIGLLGTANTLATVTGLSATGGGATLYVDPTTTLTGIFSGTSLLFDVAQTGGTLQFGSSGTGAAGATLTATAASNPTISLIADNITEGSAASTIVPGSSGTLEIAPFTSATPISLGGTSGGGTLGIGTTLLGDVASTGLLRVGEAAGSLAAGGISLAASLNLGTVTAVLELDSGGAVAQPATAALTVGTLAGSMANGATLLGTSNAIGALGAITISSGNFTLVDTGSLSVPGSLNAANVALTAGTIGVSGSIVAASGLVLLDGTSATGGIAMTGTALVNGGTVDLSSGAGITEAATSTLVAGTLQSNLNAAGTVSLLGTGNAVGDLGNFTVTAGDFYLTDSSALNVTGVLSVAANSGEIYLESSNAGGITIANGGKVSAPNNGEASFQANAFTIVTGGSVATGVYVGLGPDTNNTALSLGTLVSGELSLVSLAGISTGNLLAGGVTSPGQTFGTGSVRASSITIGGTVDTTGLGALSFYTTTGGAVTQTQPIIGGALLEGAVGSLTLLNPNNAISGLNALSASGNIAVLDSSALTTVASVSSSAGNIYVASSNTSGITLTGNVSASSGTVGLQADTLTFTSGTISAPIVELAPFHSGTLVTLGGSGGFSLANPSNIAASSLLRIGAISIPGTAGPTTTAGSIVIAGTFGGSSVALELDSNGGITETTGGLTASTLSGRAGGTIAGSANLIGSNAIGTLGNFNVGNGGSFDLVNAGSVAVTGTVSAANATITSGTIALNNGSVIAPAGTVSLTSTSGAIALNGTAVLDGATVGLNASTSIAAATTSALIAGVLTGSATSVSLAGTNNVGTLAAFTSGGNFVLNDGTALAVLGTVDAATTGTIALTAAGSLSIGSGTTSGLLNAGTVTLIASGGTISENATNGSIDANLLTGSAAAVGLGGANTIAALGTFVVTSGSFDLADSVGSLAVSGALSAAGVAITGPGTIDITAGVTATSGTLLLNGGSIVIAGGGVLTDTAGAVDLSTTGGGITESGNGSIVAKVLQSASHSAGAVSLGDANAVGTLGGFVVNSGSLLLVDGNSTNLNVTGSVSAAGVTLVAGTITTSNSIVSSGSLGLTATAAGISIGGLLDASGVLDLSAPGGGVTEVNGGTVIASTLLSGEGVSSTVSLLGTTNSIGTLGAFTVTNGEFLLVDNASLSIAGAVSAQNAVFVKVDTTGDSITLASGGALTAGGTPATVELVADTITANAGFGTITAANGTVALAAFGVGNALTLAGSVLPAVNTGTLQLGSYNDFANGGSATISAGNIVLDAALFLNGEATTLRLDSTGSVVESGAGSSIQVGTLVGTIVGGATLANTNTIATLGSITAGNLFLNDGTALTIAGPVNAGTSGTITDTQGVTVTGSLLASNTIVLTGSIIAVNSSGLINVAGGTLDLLASGGSIADAGTLIASTLNGSAQAAANFGSNTTILNIGSFNANGFVLNDGTALTVGTVIGGTFAAIGANGSLTVDGLASAATLDLTATSIAIPGEATAGTSGTVDLVATNGTINVPGTLIAGTLSGTSTAAATLNGSETIASIGSFGANGFTLNDGATNLGIGVINGGTLVSITAGSLTVGTLVSATAIDLVGTSIAIPGTVNATTGGTVDLTASTGTISESGMLIAGTLNGSAAAAASLLGNNTILNIGSFGANGFVLNDGTGLSIGTVAGGTLVSIDVAGSLAINTLIGSGTVDLITTAGPINETGTLMAGVLIGSASGTASFAGATNGGTFANQIGGLGNFSATALALNDATALTVTGPVNGGSNVAIDDAQLLTVTGSVVSTGLVSLTGSAIAITGTALVSDGGGTTDLAATAGTIFENATLQVGTLNGSAVASASFSGNNTIANVGSFSANGFVLNDGTTALNIGTVIGGTLASIDVAGSLTIGAT